MKPNFYLHLCMIGVLSVCLNVQKGYAQCGCSGGALLDSVKYTITVDSLTSIVGNLVFPQYDASIRQLNCVGLTYNVTSIFGFRLSNVAAGPRTFQFDYSQYTGVDDGYSLLVNNHVTKSYGPYNLGPTGATTAPLDSVVVGPDTLYNNQFFSANSGFTAPYLGGGTITLTYDNSYSTHFTGGSSSYDLRVRGYTKGTFTLTYYTCPQTALALKNKKASVSPGSSNENKTTQSIAIYPNPVSGSNFSLQFNKSVTGSYMIDVINITGQKIYSKNIQLTNVSQAPVDMNTTPSPGLYYLRAVDQRTGVTYTNKLVIE